MAVIDIGSNAIRLSIGHKGLINEIHSERFPLRLGKDSFYNGQLSRYTTNRFLQVLKDIQQKTKTHHVEKTRFVATSALREAKNKDYIIDKIYDRLGIEVELISGVTEAKLLFNAVKKYYTPPPLKQSLIMDIGGGSVELISYRNKKIKATSLKMGTVRLLSQSATQHHLWSKTIETQISTHIDRLKGVNKSSFFIGTGGNVKSLGKLAYYTGISKRTDRLSINSINTLFVILSGLTYRQRITQLGLKPDRADVIFPAALIIHHIMTRFNLEYVNIPRVGLRNGLFLSKDN